MKGVFLVMCIVILIILSMNIDNFMPSTSGMYHSGNDWGYWNGNPIPWNNCIDPNNPNECSPYCKKIVTRQAGATFKKDCYPICGTPCLNDNDCPLGCPKCNGGICSAPQGETYL